MLLRVVRGEAYECLFALPNWQSFLYLVEKTMAVSYKRLWKLWIDRDMKKKELCAKAGISTSSLTKMGKGGHVTTEVLAKICTALNCTVDEIMEIVSEDEI